MPLLALFLILIGLWVIIAPQPAAHDGKYPLVVSHVLHAESPKGEAFTFFSEALHKKTDGNIDIQIYPSSSRYIDVEAIEALQYGAIHFIAPTTSKLSLFVPELEVLDYPFLLDDRESYYQLLNGAYGDYIREKLLSYDLRLLAFWDNGFRHISNAIRPVVDPDDLQGLSIRVMSGDKTGYLYELFGATPQEISFAQMPQMLRLGVVNGAENTIINFYGENLMQTQPYLTLSHHSLMIYTFLMRESHYQSLAPEVQEAVIEAAEEATAHMNTLVHSQEARSTVRLEKDSRVKVNHLPEEASDQWRTLARKSFKSDLSRNYPEVYHFIQQMGFTP
ncbi:DctP family TRAP transporter solute-binding subunit [Desulfurispira natronophila]|uniref:C4-dicarboxylate-binding protein DctP n=1 Tax=Desulfurispira natronophila TaxID=682562 RepID=A0A7W7Y286_9BACT|nr:DctP family TRAP transporter solute-binding subunit [Desulfurispira natronophila]MBB5020741.1 C4-dicarboxylate-binding protein DctP [Desulfurispira natronophila]